VISFAAAIERALGLAAGASERWIVAFSGGPDSSALLVALARRAPQLGIAVEAVHVDHGLDPGSAARAERARAIAEAAGVAFHLVRLEVVTHGGESPEAAARRHRYEALEARRLDLRADRILTAHHADDQVETLFLRIRAGTSVRGLGGIARSRGALLRPLLEVSGAEVRVAAREVVPSPADDVTNRDLAVPRNLLRLRLLPRLLEREPGLPEALLRVAERARRAVGAIDREISRRVIPRETAKGEAWVARGELAALPQALRAHALATLLERAGVVPAPGAIRLQAALAALERGSRFELRLGEVRLWGGTARIGVRRGESSGGGVSYTVSLPGEVELPELGLRMRITREAVAPWMYRGLPDRAAFDLPDGVATAEVRCRRPGDRIRPLGSGGERKLKELLIDRKVPRELRSDLPLLVVGGRIVWVPGVTIDEEFRLRGGPEAWMAQLEPISPERPVGNDRSPGEVGAGEGETN